MQGTETTNIYGAGYRNYKNPYIYDASSPQHAVSQGESMTVSLPAECKAIASEDSSFWAGNHISLLKVNLDIFRDS